MAACCETCNLLGVGGSIRQGPPRNKSGSGASLLSAPLNHN